MKKLFYTLILALFALAWLQGVTLIDPAGDGGFENGSTFASNGWTLVNHTTNNWYLGALGANSGARGAYISNDNGTTNAYTISTSQTSHFYRDVTIPTGEIALLSFNWRGQGESSWDRLLVYIAPPSVTPVAGTPASSSTALTGATLLGMFNLQATWQTGSVNLAAYTGVQRLIFTWQNDGSVGTQPPISVDNISLTTYVPVPLVGTKIIGSVLPYDYPSFTAAITALNNNGVGAGGVTFQVQDGTYSENPPAITTGGTAGNPVVFQPVLGANPNVVPSGGAGSFGFKIQGADYITFDNIDINGPNTLVYGYWVNGLAGNGANNIIIKNCAITVPYGSTTNYGIYATQTDVPNNNCTYLNNQVVSPYNGIYLVGNATAGNEAQNINVSGNNLSGIRNYGIYLTNAQNSEIQYNNLSFFNNGTAVLYGIYVIGTTSSYQVHHNIINGGYTSNTVYALYHSSGTGTWEYNEVTNLYNTSTSGWYGMYAAGNDSIWRFNKVYGITNTGTATFYGAYVSTGNHTFIRNQINDISTAGTSVYGIYVIGGTTHTFNGNLIRKINYTGTSTGVVYGIHLASGTTNNVYNNMVYSLNAAASTSTNANPAIRGISVSAGTTNNVWNNTVYLNASGSNTAFSSAALHVTTSTSTIDLKNNIFVNKSVPGATGRSVVFWKSSAGVSNISASSDKNIYFTAEPPSATQAMGYFSTTTYPTLAEYKTMAATKDQASYWENVPFVSGSGEVNVHINNAVQTRVEGNAIPIQPPVTMDYDGEPRSVATPDIGADEGNFTPVGGVPGLVTLLSPVNGATNLDPISLVVNWSPPVSGGTPTRYYVFVSVDQNDFFGNQIGYYEVNHPTTSLDLATIPGLNLDCLTQYYWAVQAHNNEGDSNPDDPAFQIWGFTTMQRMTGPATVALGNVWPGTVLNKTIPVTNHGPGVMTVSANGSAEVHFSPSTVNIPAYSTHNLTYTFTVPNATGAYSGQITITQTAPGSSVLNVGVTANVTTDVAVGDGTTNQYLPVYPYYGYTYSQTIYPAAWFNYPDGYRIERLQFYWNPALAPLNTTAFKVWMGHTDLAQFPATVTSSSWIPISSMSLVFDGDWTITAGEGWKELVLQVPFVYNRSQNLVIAMDENTSGYDTSGNSTNSFFRATATGAYYGMSCYSDTYNFDPNNPDATPPSSYTSYASRQGYPNTKFILGSVPTAPVFSVTPVSWNFGTLILNQQAEKQFVISNFGGGTLSISSITVSDNTNYQLLNLPTFPVNIPSGQSIPPITLRYAPMAAGTHSATINVLANVAVEPIQISGACVDPRITSLPHTQNFDGVTTPALPLGWTGYKSNTSASVNTSTTYSQSTPNSVYIYNSAVSDIVRLISPQVTVPINQIRLKFYLRATSTGYTMKVGTVNALDGSGVFTQVASITPASSSVFTQYTVSFAGYGGTDQYLCFQHGAVSSAQSFYLDNVELEMLAANDMAAIEIKGPSFGMVGSPLTFDVKVCNNGTATQNNYEVYLTRSGGPILASMHITSPLAPDATVIHQLSWTPLAGHLGLNQIQGGVSLATDQNTANNLTQIKPVGIYSENTYMPVVGDLQSTSSANTLPTCMYWKNGVTETIYTDREMQMSSGTIHGVAYYSNFTQDLYNIPLKIYAKNTSTADLSAGWLDFAGYTLVFNGTVDFPMGINTIYIPFSTPITYTGGNFAIRVNRVMDTQYYASNNVFYYTNPQYVNSRSRYIQSDGTLYDPTNPAVGGTSNLLNNIPVTTFVVQDAVPVILAAPTGLTITKSGNNSVLNWNAVNGAYAYRIYASDDPTIWPATPVAVVYTNTYTTVLSAKRFFKVVATSSYRNESGGLPEHPAVLDTHTNRIVSEPQRNNKD